MGNSCCSTNDYNAVIQKEDIVHKLSQRERQRVLLDGYIRLYLKHQYVPNDIKVIILNIEIIKDMNIKSATEIKRIELEQEWKHKEPVNTTHYVLVS